MSRDGSIETWSRLIADEASLPKPLRGIVLREFAAFPYCVWSPAARGNYGKMPATLLCLAHGKLGILRLEDQECNALFLDLGHCDAVELGRNLLLSWIAFHHEGSRHVVWFNTVGEKLYTPFLEAFRAAREKQEGGEGDVDKYLEPMHRIDYKYFTYPRAVLGGRLPGASYYHPLVEVRSAIFHRRVISSYYLAFARGIIYTFSEERILRSPKNADYSLILRYIPVVPETTLTPGRSDVAYSWFEIEADGNMIFSFPVANTRRQELRDFATRCGMAVGPENDEASPES